MWRSIVGRRSTLRIRSGGEQGAHSYAFRNKSLRLPPQLHHNPRLGFSLYSLSSPFSSAHQHHRIIGVDFPSSQNPRLFSTHPSESANGNDDDNLASIPSDPFVSEANEDLKAFTDEHSEDFKENPTPVSSVSDACDDTFVDKEELREVDPEKLESVLSLLQSSSSSTDVNGSLDSSLDEMTLTVHEDFVVRVLETPLVPGENLIRFFKWALKKESEFSANTLSLEALVQAISAGMKKKDAYAAWDLIKEIGELGNGVVTTSILNGLLSLFSRLGKAKAAHEVFDKFGEFGCVADADTYYFTIEALCRRSFYDWACSVSENMVSSQKVPDSKKVGKVISYLSKGKNAKGAYSVYLLAKEKGKYPPRYAVNFLISSLSQEDDTVRLALAMLADFSGEERKFAINAFSSVVRGLCRIKDVNEAENLLVKMIEAGPPPGNGVFNSVISGFSKVGDMAEARKVMKLMQSRGLKPDVYTYTVIMSGFAKGGEMEEACKVLGEAKEQHSKLSPVTYHTLIRGYCKLEEYGKAVKLLGQMREFGVTPNADEYNKLIQSLCLKALDWETAEKLLEEMKENRLHLNGTTKSLIVAVKELEDEETSSGGGEETVAV